MREIKFRVWDKEFKTMWANVQNAYDTIRHHAKDNSKGLEEVLEANCFQEVLDSPQYEVMQFTGLLDKNGKEIYEGDILRDDGFIAESSMFRDMAVVWDEKACCFTRNPRANQHFQLSVHRTGMYEVIGNIHENPELLK